jgi:segregation and condensation protein B
VSHMRKKRKLRALEADLAQPEVTEALAGEALDAETEADEQAETETEAATEVQVEGEEETGETEEEKHARIKRIVEALLFASDKPLTVPRLKELTHQRTTRRIEAGLDRLRAEYQGRGIVLHEVAGGWQFRTAPECSEWVQQLVAGRPVRLSRAQLETLAIIAYRQPITRPEIDDIRGVDSSGTLHVLLDRNLVRVLGKKEEPGRPLLYGTTKEFLEFFNLAQLRDLPTLREFHELSEESLREVERLTAEGEAGTDQPGADEGDGEPDDESATA